jgi:hypothetical protein
MEAQQAVAIPFVGRHVASSTCLFFMSSTALRAFNRCVTSFRCNGVADEASIAQQSA